MKKLAAIFALSAFALTANAAEWGWDEPEMNAPVEKEMLLKEYVNQGFCWSWDDKPKTAYVEQTQTDSYSFE